MKQIITCFLLLSSITAKSQVPLAQVFHGCGGATVTAYPSDTAWTNITYQFQRFEGGSWVTVHTNTNNWHLVTPGDITVISNYRAVLRNNATNEERTSNGVTVNPALFFNTVLPAIPQITMYWGTDLNGGINAAEFLPHPFGADSRPPYTFEYKKTSDITWQSRVATTGIFIFPIDANTSYQFRVSNVCGQVSPIVSSELLSLASAVQTGTNCSGGILQINATGNGQYFAQRGPFTFGYALIPSGTFDFDSLLNSLTYTLPAGNINGLIPGQYVVRGKDRFGVLTKYTVANIVVDPPAPPFVISYGPEGGPFGPFCRYFATIQSNPFQKGIRVAGSAQPYTFSTGTTYNNLLGGVPYETVLKDTCDSISAVSLLSLPAIAPRINNLTVTKSNCNFVYTINASVCTSAEYGLKLSGSNTITWQNSNVFSNIAMTVTCDSVFVRDISSGLITKREVCKEGFLANIFAGRTNPDCNSNYYIDFTPINNNPPYTYSISYDGTNFSSPTSNNVFTDLQPGTYTVRAFDGCGLPVSTANNETEAGSVYYLKEKGVNTNCANGDTVGSYMKFGLRLFQDDDILSPPPYYYIVKEVIGSNGAEIFYGNTVSTGQSQDTVFTIRGLQGDKNYGIFVTNGCGQEFTSAKRVANSYYIPPFVPLASDPQVDVSNCNAPYIFVSSLPSNSIVRIFSGRDTTGPLVPMLNVNTSSVLQGGYYTVKVQTENNNPCYSEKVNEVFVKTNDSTSAGQFDPSVSSAFCAGLPNAVSLHNNIINESPGGGWSSSPVLNWSNLPAGEFIPANQNPGTYTITYADTSACGNASEVSFQIIIDFQNCSLSGLGDFESAASPAGCKSYTGNGWIHVFNNTGNLVYSINAGNGNTIQSACWGVRAVSSFGNPRTTVINGSTVYFAARNFYIEPSGTTITNPPVRIRLYYGYDEINQLLGYLQANGFPSATVNSLRILKKQAGQGSPVNLDITNDPGTPSSLYSSITPVAALLVPGFGYYFEFEISSFSELAIVFSNNVALPVSWLSVNGKIQNNNAIIEWATATENNSSHFEIEHSSNGLSFTKAGAVTAAGNNNSISRYSFTHFSPATGKNYYRIKQVDLDGKYNYSRVIVLNSNIPVNTLQVSPNPAHDFINVNINIIKPALLRIYNMQGKMVQQLLFTPGNQQRSIDISALPVGMYQLQLQTNEGMKTKSFIKQ